jgi:hypothetical protein
VAAKHSQLDVSEVEDLERAQALIETIETRKASLMVRSIYQSLVKKSRISDAL